MSTVAQVRRAVSADVPAIHRIECASFGDPWSEASFRAMLDHPQVRMTVAEVSGEIVGYTVALVVGTEAELANLAVDADRRRTGVGGRLLDDLLQALDGHGTDATYLEVRAGNEAAQRLYAGRGFVAAGRRVGYYRSPTEDAIVMRRAVGAEGDGR